MGIKVEKLVRDLEIDVILTGNAEKELSLSDVSRPGLQFAGYYDYFAHLRLQVLGRVEMSYLDTLAPDVRKERLHRFFEFDVPGVIIARGLEPQPELISEAAKRNVWLLKSNIATTRLVNMIMNYLDREMAEITVVHGELVNVYGVGILITGKSGIGKSETALELIKRGHMLVSDDAVEIKCIDGILYGRSPYVTSGMLEVRGMGIIDVAALYGMSSITNEKTVDLSIDLDVWDDGKEYDRLGCADEKISIAGVSVKRLQIPITPGRNVAVIIEAAAVNYRYGFLNHETALEKIEKRMKDMEK